MHERGLVDINVGEFEQLLVKLTVSKTTRLWSEITFMQASRSILATLRDLGVLRGGNK